MIIGLGDKVRDRVTGFVGVAIVRHTYLYGNSRITIQPACDEEGFMRPADTFDEAQLEVVNSWNEVLNYRSD